MTALVLALTSCGGDPIVAPTPADPTVARPPAVVEAAGPTRWRAADPAPVLEGKGEEVDDAGGVVDLGQVQVDFPAHASTGRQVLVRPGKPIGVVGAEWFGQPVHVERAGRLTSPATVTWETAGVPAEAARAAVLVHWDETRRVWEATDAPLTYEDGRLSAEVSHFSFWDVVAGLSQEVNQVVGTRVEEPHCNGARLHDWVQQTVDPDETVSSAPIRVCFENDEESRVTVRVANNRTFTQRLVMDRGGQEWAWTWPGPASYGIESTVLDAARHVFDTPTTYLLPPLHETAVGIGRPAAPGSYMIAATPRVDPVTVLTDVGVFAAGQVPVGGLKSPVGNAWLQALYECGGSALLGGGLPADAPAMVRRAVTVLGSCAEELMRPESQFGARFERLVQQQIRTHPGAGAEDWAKGYRMVRVASRIFKALTAAQVAFYATDQLAASLVGGFPWSIRGRGQPQELGSFDATCSDVGADSDRLYRNVALRDEFAGTDKDLWELPGWSEAVDSAITPFEECDAAYVGRLATQVQGDWADERAAAVVATALTQLSTDAGADLSGEWYVHGGRLDVAADGTARSEGHGSCPASWTTSTWCNEVLEMTWQPSGRGIRLDVRRVYVEDENGRTGPPDQMGSVSVGSYFLMWAVRDGAAKTELHNDDGVVRGANGLGNPYLCRSGATAASRGVCGA